MNGSHFVVGLKDTVCSEKVWKLKVCSKRILILMGKLRSVVPEKWNHETKNRCWFSWNYTGHTHAFAQ